MKDVSLVILYIRSYSILNILDTFNHYNHYDENYDENINYYDEKVINARTVNKNFKLENLNKFLKSIKATISSGQDSINNLLLKIINWKWF